MFEEVPVKQICQVSNFMFMHRELMFTALEHVFMHRELMFIDREHNFHTIKLYSTRIYG
jgi:hypothetical protein